MMFIFSKTNGIRLLIKSLRPFRGRVALLFVLDLLAGLLAIFFSLLLAQTIALIFGFNSVRAQVSGIVLYSVAWGLGTLAFITGLKLLNDYVRLYQRERLADAFIRDLRARLFQHYLHSDAGAMDEKGQGRALLRLSGELGAVRSLLTRGIMQFGADAVLLLLGLGFIGWLNPLMALLVALVLGVAGLITHRINMRLQAAESNRRAKKMRLFRLLHRSLTQLGAIQALNRTTRVLQRFERHNARLSAAALRYYGKAAWSGSLPWFWVQSLLLLVLSGAALAQTLPTPLFAIVFLMMSWRSPLSRLFKAGALWKKGLLSLRQVEQTLRPSGAATGLREIPRNGNRQITFEQVGLRFGEKTVFEALSFTLAKGQMTRLQMGCGEGKTSIVRLLAGMYTPSAGLICFDGQDARLFTAHSLRRQLAFVSDTFPLGGDDLIDALSNSSKSAAQDNARQALRDWQAVFPALRTLPPLAHLSAGQQVLLQCLRAKLSDKPFWVLDDPFSRLDAESARLLEHVLLEITREKGMLLLTQPGADIFFEKIIPDRQ